MSVGIYMGVDGGAAKIIQIYIGVEGGACRVIKGYIGIDGGAQPFWSAPDVHTTALDGEGAAE